jgi:uncharacterized protein
VPEPNPCTDCGACCAHFRVSFHWAEEAARVLPPPFIEKLDPRHVCMTGTNRQVPRCAALAGEIGATVSCTVYDQRPAPCREVQPGDDKCLRARRRHGLAAIEPQAA